MGLPLNKLFVTGDNAEKIDLVITLGGDGTILHASSLFKVGAVPPVLSFSMGTLGFLLPFRQSTLFFFFFFWQSLIQTGDRALSHRCRRLFESTGERVSREGHSVV